MAFKSMTAVGNANPRSKQTQLRRIRLRLAEMLGGKLRARGVEAKLLAGKLKAASDQICVRPGALLPREPLGIVILAAAHVSHQLEDVAFAVRVIRLEPFAEQVAHLERQAQQHVARFLTPA